MKQTLKINQIKDKILNSNPFKNRKLHQQLLEYLINCYLKGETPKEITIALDVFDKDNNFNPSEDTIVRVHMHKLRKLLETYYNAEGHADSIRLTIPKGHYKIELKEQEHNRFHKSSRNLYIYISIFFMMTTIVLALILVTKKSKSTFISNNNCIWNNYFNNDMPNSILIGDFYVFHEFDEKLGKTRRIQDYEINNINDFEEYKSHYPERYPENWVLGELPHNSIFNLKNLSKIFYTFEKNYDIEFTTNIDIDFIKNRNIVYIGEFKNLRVLSDIVTLLPFHYETLPEWHGSISFEAGDSSVTLKTYHDWNISRYVVDLGVVAKIPGENNENYLFFIGFGYNAQVELVTYFTSENSIDEIKSQLPKEFKKIPDYFVAIYEISGFDRANSKVSLKYFKEINKDIYNQYNPAESINFNN